MLYYNYGKIWNGCGILVNIVVCDDSAEYTEIIAYKIEQCMKYKIKMEYKITCLSCIEELQAHIEHNNTDIIFLDIMLNDENSMNWSLENIKSKYIQIIFMTSYPQCAYKISESNCCYYLVKSKITEENLIKALQRALQNTTKKDPNLTIVKSGFKSFVINLQDIQYIETFNNNITIHFLASSDITIYSTLKEYSKTLPPNFLRCHKSYMINMNHITGYEPHKFIIDSSVVIPIPPKNITKQFVHIQIILTTYRRIYGADY